MFVLYNERPILKLAMPSLSLSPIGSREKQRSISKVSLWYHAASLDLPSNPNLMFPSIIVLCLPRNLCLIRRNRVVTTRLTRALS